MNRGVCLLWVVSSLLYFSAVVSQSTLDAAIGDATDAQIASPPATDDGTSGGTADGTSGGTADGTADGTTGGTDSDGSLSPDDLLAKNNLADETDTKLGDLELFAEKVLSLTKDLPPEYCKEVKAGYAFQDNCSDQKEFNSKYRQLDGTCNNLENPNWGKAKWPLLRLAPAAYADGVSAERAHRNPDLSLPNAREVSRVLGTKADIQGNDPYGSMALAILGQFIDHDLTHAPQFGSECNECPTPDGLESTCCPIQIKENDPFYAGKMKCMALPRTIGVNSHLCPFDESGQAGKASRDHLNDITGYMDGSAIYGSHQYELDEILVENEPSVMKTIEHTPGLLPFLPVDHTEKMCHGDEKENVGCALAGDSRAAEQPTLTAFHTMGVRYHNQIVKQLKKQNSEWNDEKLFQETKKIVSAVLQHIVFNEYLPALLGAKQVKNFDLKIRRGRDGYKGYDKTLSATISNEFAGAAYRLGHSQIPDELETRSDDNQLLKSIPLHHVFFNASALHDREINGMNGFVLGNINQRVNKIDRHFSQAIQGHLFRTEDDEVGLDLIAMNLQRGREHGIDSYTVYYEKCNHNNKKISSWTDYLGVFQDDGLVKELEDLYGAEGYREIDLFIGLMLEKHVEGGRVGPTLACLVGEQFSRVRHGDRFWYERNEPEGFSDSKLAAIKQVTLSSVICSTLDNSENLAVQPYALYTPVCPCDSVSNEKTWADYTMDTDYPGVHLELPGFTNRRVKCSDETAIPRLNLDPWQETKVSDSSTDSEGGSLGSVSAGSSSLSDDSDLADRSSDSTDESDSSDPGSDGSGLGIDLDFLFGTGSDSSDRSLRDWAENWARRVRRRGRGRGRGRGRRRNRRRIFH